MRGANCCLLHISSQADAKRMPPHFSAVLLLAVETHLETVGVLIWKYTSNHEESGECL